MGEWRLSRRGLLGTLRTRNHTPSNDLCDPILPLVRLTCPIALLRFYPIRLYWVLLANAATYALVGLIVEALRQRRNQARKIKTVRYP